MTTITVKAIQGGWAVEGRGQVLMFLTGGAAERKARELAALCVRLGAPARVLITDLAGRLVGEILFEAEAAAA